MQYRGEALSPRAGAARRQECSAADARARLRQAEACLEVAQLVTTETARPEDYDYNHVAAGLGVTCRYCRQ